MDSRSVHTNRRKSVEANLEIQLLIFIGKDFTFRTNYVEEGLFLVRLFLLNK